MYSLKKISEGKLLDEGEVRSKLLALKAGSLGEIAFRARKLYLKYIDEEYKTTDAEELELCFCYYFLYRQHEIYGVDIDGRKENFFATQKLKTGSFMINNDLFSIFHLTFRNVG